MRETPGARMRHEERNADSNAWSGNLDAAAM